MTDAGKKALEELVAGLDGLAGGTWSVDGPKHSLIVYTESGDRICFMTSDGANTEHAAHIARCSPDRIRAIAAYVATLEAALNKINGIRSSIIGTQTMNWSEHVYPLVAALNEAGFAGMEYPEAREYFGTMLERTVAAEARATAAEAKVAELERERDDATGTLKYCEKQWSEERGTMINKFSFERTRADAAEGELSTVADHLESGASDSDAILHSIREIEADLDIFKERATAAEERVKRLEALLADLLPPKVEWKERDVDSVLVHHQISVINRARAYLRERAALTGDKS